jgi:D-alanyl-lipoteichoic acid acyltransferase DltB (MBOAT superfamily)
MLVFLLSGLWHGANWTFIVWGGLHGMYYIIERYGGQAFAGLPGKLGLPVWLVSGAKILVTFHVVVLAWVFFRARSIQDAWLILGRMATDLTGPLNLGPSALATAIAVLLIFILVAVQFTQARGHTSFYLSPTRLPVVARWCGYYALLLGMALLGKTGNDFIYFQF